MSLKIFLRKIFFLVAVLILAVCIVSGFISYNNTKRLFRPEYSYPREDIGAIYDYKLKSITVYLTEDDLYKIELADKLSTYSMFIFFGFGIASELLLRILKD